MITITFSSNYQVFWLRQWPTTSWPRVGLGSIYQAPVFCSLITFLQGPRDRLHAWSDTLLDGKIALYLEVSFYFSYFLCLHLMHLFVCIFMFKWTCMQRPDISHVSSAITLYHSLVAGASHWTWTSQVRLVLLAIKAPGPTSLYLLAAGMTRTCCHAQLFFFFFPRFPRGCFSN